MEFITVALLNNPEPVFICVKKYNEEFTQDIINGDVFIVEESKNSHKAGVYLDEQIIQLKMGGLFSSTEVIRVNVKSFTGEEKFAVYRKREGIPQSFQENVAEALSGNTENKFSQYNSVEVVMEILDVHLEAESKESFTMNDPKPGFICVKKYNEEFTQDKINGDVFIVDESEKTPQSWSLLRWTDHAAENGLKMGSSDSFQDRVDEAMRTIKEYKNCIYFALELIYGKELKLFVRGDVPDGHIDEPRVC
ncbi:hypothetical protein C0J45_17006 [Silurus meridionalis]|nr:hypothetical protein C0J45_17006 [Silurus meridionalis]